MNWKRERRSDDEDVGVKAESGRWRGTEKALGKERKKGMDDQCWQGNCTVLFKRRVVYGFGCCLFSLESNYTSNYTLLQKLFSFL